MGELFEAKDRGDTFAVFRRMFFTPQHRYYVLTRNPKIAQQYPNELGLIKNLWFGVTIESEGFIDRANWLKTIPAQVRYVSCEPLLGMIDLRPQLSAGEISWVIVGAMTGPNAIKPDSKWLSWIVQDCDQFKVPVFVKNNLVRLCPEFTGRQEMPK
jgi:protein gp37